MTIDVELQPKELELLRLIDESDAALIGYGGARGGAKSHAVRACAVLRRLKYPGTKACIFRKTYPQLLEQHIVPMMEEWPEFYKRYWSSEHRGLMLPGKKPGQVSPIYFRYGDTIKDINDHRGKEWGDLFIDECNDLQEHEVAILRSCCRSTADAPGFVPKRVYTFNPGGVGHSFLKRIFIDRDLSPAEEVLKPQFIQAYAWDNVMWVKDALAADGVPVKEWYTWPRDRQIEYLVTRSDYGKDLNALPEHYRRPWLYGDWDTFSGQMFSEWRRDIHVVKPFKIPRWWTRWMANDPGYKDPSVWYWFAADGDGNVYVYRERTYHEVTQSEQGKAITEIVEAEGEKVAFIVTGMDAFVVRDRSVGKTDVDYYSEGGLSGFVRPVHGADARAARAKTVHEYLRPFEDAQGNKVARLRVFGDLCPKLLSTLPALPMDENDPDAVAECSIDHWYDALGYGLQAWHARKSTAPEVPAYTPGSAGDILKHAEKIRGGKKRDRVFG